MLSIIWRDITGMLNKVNHKMTLIDNLNVCDKKKLGPVVQSIVSLTRSLRGQLVKWFVAL